MPSNRELTIGHVSDLHYTSGSTFEPEVFDEGVEHLNARDPDVVVVSGDLTDWGLRAQWKAIAERLEAVDAPVLPCLGNHDSHREGWRIFQDTFGRDRYYTEDVGEATFYVLDSSEPDLHDGHVGREQRAWMVEQLRDDTFPIVVMHHHVVPIPHTGRERNVLRDAGNMLQCLVGNSIPVVLGGHRHHPWVWNLERTLVAHAGTFSSNKRQMPPSYNLVTVGPDEVTVDLVKFQEDAAHHLVTMERDGRRLALGMTRHEEPDLDGDLLTVP